MYLAIFSLLSVKTQIKRDLIHKNRPNRREVTVIEIRRNQQNLDSSIRKIK